MQEVLVVIDMQNDFIDGALGSKEAQAIVPYVIEKVKNFNGPIVFTRDTHYDDYMEKMEGKFLPIPHCIKGSKGWEIQKDLDKLRENEAIDKPTFGSKKLPEVLKKINDDNPISKITFVGLDTDICVISNVLITKAFFPEILIEVDAKGCAGVSPLSHQRALEAMKVCQIVVNE